MIVGVGVGEKNVAAAGSDVARRVYAENGLCVITIEKDKQALTDTVAYERPVLKGNPVNSAQNSV